MTKTPAPGSPGAGTESAVFAVVLLVVLRLILFLILLLVLILILLLILTIHISFLHCIFAEIPQP